MHRLLLALITLTLTACAAAPQVAVVTPIMRSISPQEAGAIIIDATNTAAAVATQAALATATEISARATSTTAWRSTQDAVTLQQTVSALDLTQAAGQGAATEISGVKTQAAGQTATWGPPTLQAVATRAAATARALVAADVAATADAIYRHTLRQTWNGALLVIVSLILLALGLAAAFGLSDLLSARAALVRARADHERADAQRLAIMQYGGFLLQLKGQRWEVMPPPQLAAPQPAVHPLAVEPAAGDVREVPIRAHQEVVSTIQVGQAETPERERVISLLRSAIGVTSPGARHIPPATAMSMHPMDWQGAVDQLKAGADRPAYVEVRLGRPKAGENGTRLVHPDYRTLGLLLQGVTRGEVLPRPKEPARRVVD